MVALFLATLVWAIITGKERSYEEKTIEVSPEYYNVNPSIVVSSVIPYNVRIKVRGTSNQLEKISEDNFKIRIDLERIKENSRFNVFAEDALQYPTDIAILSIQPKMIEITTTEISTREVPVKVRYVGQLKSGVVILERRITPNKIKIFGYKSQVFNINEVEAAEYIDLSDITKSETFSLPLKKVKEIIRFEGNDFVTVSIIVENKNDISDSKTINK